MASADLETYVKSVCAEILRRSDISLDDDLIALGMDSLAAVEIVTRLEIAFGVDVINTLFETATIRQLCSTIEGAIPATRRLPLTATANVLDLVAEAAGKFGSAPYLLPGEPGEEAITFSDVLTFGKGCAALLDEHEVPADASVAVVMHNSALAVLLFLGMLCAQRTVVFLNPKAAPAELDVILEHAGPALLCARETTATRLRQRWPWVSIDDEAAFLAAVLARGSAYQGQLTAREGSAAQDAEIVYTSGSTGTPKGVVLSHGSLLAGSASLARWADADRDDVFLNVNPMFHAGGHVFPTLTPLWCGGQTACVRPEAGLARFWSLVDQWDPTWTLVVNAYLAHLVEKQERPRATRLKGVLAGGSPLSPKLIHRFEETFGLPVYQVYGMTEMATITTVEPRDRRKEDQRSAGLPLDCAQVRVVDPDGQDLPSGQNGEVLLNGANRFTRYLNDPELTATRLRDGWIHTGDLGHLDSRGELAIVDRLDSMVIVSGENLYPAEVEGAVPYLKGVEDAVLVTLPHPVTGVELVLVYKLLPGATADVDEWRAAMLESLSAFKVPRRFVPLAELAVESFPRTPLGKILRPEVQRLATEHLS